MRALFLAPLIVLLAVTLGASPLKAEDWNFSLTPYVWLPAMGGELKYDIPPGSGGSPNVEAGPSKLNFAIMLGGEARKGKWSILADLIYLNVSGSAAKTLSVNLPDGSVVPVVDAGTTSGVKSSLITLAPGYSVYETSQANMDVFGGIRHMTISTNASWNITGPVGAFPAVGSTTQSKKLIDGIIGMRGQVNLEGGQWSLPYYVDIGSGSSNFTWQGIAGVSYAFSWGDLRLSYRHLEYDFGSKQLLQNFSLSGPALGAAFHF